MSKEEITKKLRNKKYRNISIGVIVCLFILSIVFAGVSANSPVETSAADVEDPVADVEIPAADEETPAADVETPAADVETPAADVETPAAPVENPKEVQSETKGNPTIIEPENKTELDSTRRDTPEQTEEKKPSKEADDKTKEPQVSASDKEEPPQTNIEPEKPDTTEPEKPEKAPPEETAPRPKDTISVSIEIECTAISQDLNLVTDKSIIDYIPKDGYILHKKTIEVKAKTNAFELTEYACNANGIALDFSYTPAFGTNYIKGIGYIYEKMAGSQSGWMYMVNGAYPNKGCDTYKLQDGDHVTWTYVTRL